jgi:hypothetical protein
MNRALTRRKPNAKTKTLATLTDDQVCREVADFVVSISLTQAEICATTVWKGTHHELNDLTLFVVNATIDLIFFTDPN